LTTRPYDAVVIGAGIVGSACAYYLTRAGLSVAVVERGGVAAGTSGEGEGNLLLSDKVPGPELDLMLLSVRLWQELDAALGPMELEAKGGLVVADTAGQHDDLQRLAASQRTVGVEAVTVDPAGLSDLEPHLAPGKAGGMYYPGDLQVQPMRAAAQLLHGARQAGAELRFHCEVTGLQVAEGRITGVQTAAGPVAAGLVVNAAGTWAGQISAFAGLELPILPRRGFVLVTEPLPRIVRHKVYTTAYVDNVASGDAGLETSPVVEGTLSGTILIGASRERVGFDRTTSMPVAARLAAQAVRLFPILAGVRAIRIYRGFRPYCPDHLPVIGPDRRLPGLWHACGHEGAGVGLAPATGRVIADLVTGARPALPVHAFSPDRFTHA
jgi:D-hydroxyproline dehydrogenase subunit beta